MSRYTGPTAYVFAWRCTDPPPLVEFDFPPGESPGDYRTITDYIQRFAESVESSELIEAVSGGKETILNSLFSGPSTYDDKSDIENDWRVNWHRSRYPDGTPIYFFTHSGIEHVFEPIGYRNEKT